MVDRRKSSSDKKKVVAALLCLFIGPLGVHRFYVGKVGTGILMIGYAIPVISYEVTLMANSANYEIEWEGLVLLWLWAIIDFVKIIKGSFGDKENRGLS